MTFGSLFAGIGGFDLGLERAGMTCKWQVEIDPFCRAVLERHWPDVRRTEDVRAVHCRDFCEHISGWCFDCLEDVDVICGGFPCKQTSRAAAITGRRVGLAGRDSGLWHQQRRIIGELQPRIAIVENPDSEWLTEVSIDLAGLGYGVRRYEIEAAHAGAPHLRRRVFLVADRDQPGLAEHWAPGPSEVESREWLTTQRDAWLSSISGIVRVDDGIPGGVHRRQRINAIGNAVVPAVAEWLGRRIVEADAAS